ncbi:MAG: response regulator [Candidatus Omnitrophica bacterium]|nr:response regulator [Candidatus Omnitrophota bacterium]
MTNRIKVLMADDEPDVLEIMSRRVAAEGFEVVTARDGQEAWEKIQAESPDVILLDIIMPRMDGYTVLRNLRTNPPSEKWQPVIIVSSKTDFGDMQQGFSLQADHYITKPCTIRDIIKGIQLMASLIPQRKPSDQGSEEKEES